MNGANQERLYDLSDAVRYMVYGVKQEEIAAYFPLFNILLDISKLPEHTNLHVS